LSGGIWGRVAEIAGAREAETEPIRSGNKVASNKLFYSPLSPFLKNISFVFYI
jgi:hypothetical protein